MKIVHLDRLMKRNSDTIDVSNGDDQKQGGGSVTKETHTPPRYDAYGSSSMYVFILLCAAMMMCKTELSSNALLSLTHVSIPTPILFTRVT